MNELLTKKGFHITHNDADAVGCALVASLAYPELKLEDTTYFCTIGPEPSEVVTEAIIPVKSEKGSLFAFKSSIAFASACSLLLC